MTEEIILAIGQTLYMVFVAGLIAVLIGLPLGILLWATRPQQLFAHTGFNRALGFFINALRSIPFIILMIAIIPFTRLMVGTSIGTAAAIVPLAMAAFPFVARVMENALVEVPYGLIEASQAMGATPCQIIYKVLLREAMPSIVNGITLMIVTLIGYSAMAGAVGGGGLGDLAIRYGYERFQVSVMVITVVILIVMVQCIQWLGDAIARWFSKSR
ncbi:MAG TPA: methionine ABC transporter permease [Coxiellaceae bacterium]|nr:methionine ABC transporter permease [Coxiellaceae bacterium]